MTDKLDTATIRELLKIANRAAGVPRNKGFVDIRFHDAFTAVRCAELARYALELSDKVEALEKDRISEMERESGLVTDLEQTVKSQAAELERLRAIQSAYENGDIELLTELETEQP